MLLVVQANDNHVYMGLAACIRAPGKRPVGKG